jgi:type IV pilus biogenesis protein CpaD/CtpE
MRTLPIPALSGLALLALSGCATTDPQFGSVVQNNIIAQTVDLEPVYAGVPIEGGNAARTVDGVRRYTSGAVKPLVAGSLSKTGSGGGPQ